MYGLDFGVIGLPHPSQIGFFPDTPTQDTNTFYSGWRSSGNLLKPLAMALLIKY